MTKISILAGIGCGITAWLYAGGLGDAQIVGIAGALVTLSATSLGFLLTALSVFAALITRELVQRLHNTGHYGKLVRQMFVASAAFLGSAVTGVACLFLHAATAALLLAISSGFAAAASFALCVVGYRFYLVLLNIR